MARIVRGVSTRKSASTAGFSGICPLGPSASRLLDRRLQQVVDQLPGFLRMRAAFDDGQRVGDEERSQFARPLVGVDDRDGLAAFDFDKRIVGIGQAKGKLACGDGLGNLLVAGHDLDVVGLQVAEELSGGFVAERREKACGVGRRRAEQRFGNAGSAPPLRIGQVVDRRGAIGLRDEVRIDQQDARPAAKPCQIPSADRQTAG